MQQLIVKVFCSAMLLLAMPSSVSAQSDCSQAESCDLCVGNSMLNLTGCVWRLCPDGNDTGMCVNDEGDSADNGVNCSWTRVSELCTGDGRKADSSPEFSQAKFDMSSFIGGIILVLCLQAGGFFAMRFLKSKEQSSYDPISADRSPSADQRVEGVFSAPHTDLDTHTFHPTFHRWNWRKLSRMEEEGQSDSSLDLSYLTEEEQSSILQVLQRDSDLRHRDEGRIRILQQTETDPSRLRSLSGAWFSEERSKRYHSRSSSSLIHATISHRKTKSRDVPLTELFNGEGEEASHKNSTSPEAERRLKDGKKEDSRGGQGILKPTPTPRTKSPAAQDRNSLASSRDSEIRSNGPSEEPEDEYVSHNGDTDSLGSSLTEPEPSSLKTSSSTGSLHSGYTLSGSMMSLFSTGDFGAVDVRGRIQFSLVFHSQKEELQVKVYRCEDLATARKSRSDPYVKAYLLPDKSNHSKKKTTVKKKTLNPVFDQTLRYKVRIGELRSRTLNLSVWHAEPLGRNVFLGEVEVSLGLWDWTFTQPLWQDLQPRVHLSPESINSRGTIVLSIKFIPDGYEGGGLPLTGELHIWLREAQGLLSNKGGPIDSFVRSYILPDASRQSGQKTRVMKRSISPTFNHTMVYDGFHTSDLKEACAELTVWQREGLKTHVLGGIRLSCGTGQSYGEAVSWMDSTEEEVTVWTSMIKNPNHWIDTALPIRTNLARRPE
ncbi:uncharacterized protein V6R79_014437 [Siganus canaliculatus]